MLALTPHCTYVLYYVVEKAATAAVAAQKIYEGLNLLSVLIHQIIGNVGPIFRNEKLFSSCEGKKLCNYKNCFY